MSSCFGGGSDLLLQSNAIAMTAVSLTFFCENALQRLNCIWQKSMGYSISKFVFVLFDSILFIFQFCCTMMFGRMIIFFQWSINTLTRMYKYTSAPKMWSEMFQDAWGSVVLHFYLLLAFTSFTTSSVEILQKNTVNTLLIFSNIDFDTILIHIWGLLMEDITF